LFPSISVLLGSMNRTLLISLGVIAVAAVATWKGCRYDWNPHYAGNKSVCLDAHSLYNLDSSVAVVGYTLDVGARGARYYTTLLRKADYQGDLSKFMLPAEYMEPTWRGKDTLEVLYDEGEAFRRGGNVTNVDKKRDMVILNGIVIKVKERRLNRPEAIDKFTKSNGF
jgi:hypothetical protein